MRNVELFFRLKTARRLSAAGLGLTVLSVARAAFAVPCNALNLPNPVYGTGGSAVTATLSKVAALLAGLEPPSSRITVLYSDTLSACPGYGEFLNDNITPTVIRYWNAQGQEQTCEPPLAGGQPADFAHMGNAAFECPAPNNVIPAGTASFPAPIQTLNIITSVNSTQNAISAEALYFAYKFGDTSGVAPWTLTSHLSGRQPGAFISLFIAAGLPLQPAQFLGDRFNTQNLLIADIVANAATNADATLGFVSGSAADAQRKRDGGPQIKTLAYQGLDQKVAYYPDSTAESFDKLNVRRGQYHFWAPGHFFAKVDSQGKPTNPIVENLIGWFNATIAGPEGLSIEQIQAAIINAGDVPVCATEVTREGLGGPISSFAPTTPCYGFFEQTANGTTSHTPCPSGNECADGEQCRFGFCESY